MKKKEIEENIVFLKEMIADPSVPSDEKEMHKKTVAGYEAELEKIEKPKVTRTPEEKGVKADMDEAIGKLNQVVRNAKKKRKDKKEKKAKSLIRAIKPQSKSRVDWEADVYEHMDMPHGDADGILMIESNAKILDKFFKAGKSGKAAAEAVMGGDDEKITIGGVDIKEMDCDEVVAKVREEWEADRKSGRKSQSKPVMEKAAKNVATALKQTIEDIPAADIAKDHAWYMKKFESLESKAKEFISELKELAGESLSKEKLDKAFGGLNELIAELKKNK
jgi:hypothetical protein